MHPEALPTVTDSSTGPSAPALKAIRDEPEVARWWGRFDEASIGRFRDHLTTTDTDAADAEDNATA